MSDKRKLKLAAKFFILKDVSGLGIRRLLLFEGTWHTAKTRAENNTSNVLDVGVFQRMRRTRMTQSCSGA